MRSIQNTIIGLFIVILLFSSCFSGFARAEDSVPVRNHKVIAVVYDDSGSMTGDNWSYANYAMQAFTAMLNQGDQLFLVYMSQPSRSTQIDSSDLASAVRRVREHSDMGGTPFESVETAVSQLKGIREEDPNAQFWLVVFTDGGFTDVEMSEVQNTLDDFASTKMSNGSEPHVMYMTIRDDSGSYTPSASHQNIQILPAKDGVEIVSSIFSISSQVSGRFRVEDSDITFVDGKTVTVNSDIPLLTIGILTQNTKAEVVDVKTIEGASVPIKSKIPISAPDPSNPGAEGSTEDSMRLFGEATLAGEETRNIPAGKYTISFSEELSKDDLLIMFEPALYLRLNLLQDGMPVSDLTSIPEGAEGLEAKAELYEFGTNNLVSESLLPGGVVKKTEHTLDGQTVSSADSLELSPVSAERGSHTVTASLELPGYFHLESSVSFSPLSVQISRMTAEVVGDGSVRQKDKNGNTDGEDVVYISKLGENRTGIRFTLYTEDGPIDKVSALVKESDFRNGLSLDFNNYKVEVQDDGSFLVYPSKKPWYYHSFLYYALHHGQQSIRAEIDGVQEEESLTFKYGDQFVVELLKLVIPLYLIWWLLFKKHFPGETLVHGLGKQNSLGTWTFRESESIELNWVGAFRQRHPILFLVKFILMFLPFSARVSFCGYTFTGNRSLVRRGNTYLTVRNVKGKGVSTASSAAPGSYPERETEMDATLFIRDGQQRHKFWFDN